MEHLSAVNVEIHSKGLPRSVSRNNVCEFVEIEVNEVNVMTR